MGKLFCILGKSGVGKNTLFDLILNDADIDIKPVVPYTTRPMRENETNGVEYHFVSVPRMNEMDAANEIIEKREYQTIKGLWHYFTVKFDISGAKNHIIITTPYAIPKFMKGLGAENVVVVYLYADDKTRLERSISRESKEAAPNYAEVCRRYLADEEDFKGMAGWYHAHKFDIDTACNMKGCLAQFKAWYMVFGEVKSSYAR